MSKEVRSQKLDSIARCLERISTNIPQSAKVLENDVDKQDILILNLERLIQLCVDVAVGFLSDRNWLPLPDTMANTFRVLKKRGIISELLSERLAKSVGFRNLCVQEYDKINWAIVFAIVTNHLDDFRHFAKIIDKQP